MINKNEPIKSTRVRLDLMRQLGIKNYLYKVYGERTHKLEECFIETSKLRIMLFDTETFSKLAERTNGHIPKNMDTLSFTINIPSVSGETPWKVMLHKDYREEYYSKRLDNCHDTT